MPYFIDPAAPFPDRIGRLAEMQLGDIAFPYLDHVPRSGSTLGIQLPKQAEHTTTGAPISLAARKIYHTVALLEKFHPKVRTEQSRPACQ